MSNQTESPQHTNNTPRTNLPADETIDVATAIDELHEQITILREQLSGIIVGQEEVSEQLLIGMLCRGH